MAGDIPFVIWVAVAACAVLLAQLIGGVHALFSRSAIRYGTLGLIVFAAAAMLRWGDRSVFVRTFALFFALIALWWLPYVRELYSWVFATSFGRLAQETAKQTGGAPGVWQMTFFYVDTLAKYQLYIVLAIAAFAAATSGKDERRKLLDKLASSAVLWFGMGALPIIVLMTAMSAATDPRRGMLAMMLFLALLLIVALSEIGRLRVLRVTVISLVAVAQIIWLYVSLIDQSENRQLGISPFVARPPAPNKVAPGKDVAVAEWLMSKVPAGARVVALSPFASEQAPFNPFTLQMLVLKNDGRFYISIPVFPGNMQEYIGELRTQGIRHLLLDVDLAAAATTEAENSYQRTVKQLIRAYASNDLEKYGLRKVDAISLGHSAALLAVEP